MIWVLQIFFLGGVDGRLLDLLLQAFFLTMDDVTITYRLINNNENLATLRVWPDKSYERILMPTVAMNLLNLQHHQIGSVTNANLNNVHKKN